MTARAPSPRWKKASGRCILGVQSCHCFKDCIQQGLKHSWTGSDIFVLLSEWFTLGSRFSFHNHAYFINLASQDWHLDSKSTGVHPLWHIFWAHLGYGVALGGNRKVLESLGMCSIKGKIFPSYSLMLTLAISTGSYLPMTWDLEQANASDKSFRISF